MRQSTFVAGLLLSVLFSVSPVWAGQTSEDMDFAFLQSVAEQKPDENTIISSVNIAKALDLLRMGAKGKTAEELAGFVRLSPQKASLDGALSVKTALCAWLRKDAHDLLPAYKEQIEKAHTTGGTFFRSNPADMASDINGCVSKATDGQIHEVLQKGSRQSADQRFVLSTVMHFKGKWLEPFKSKETVDALFTTSKKNKVHMSFMNKYTPFNYLASDQGQLIQIPYKDDGLVLTLFLPAPQLSVLAWHQNLTREMWLDSIQKMQSKTVDLALPKIDVSFEKSLAADLRAVGLQVALGPAADYTGINGEKGLSVDDLLHKTAVTWDEEGTTASAVTTVVMRNAVVLETVKMTVDRPFFFTIGTRDNGVILFAGIINGPKE